MTRAEALEAAYKLVGELSATPTNGRGYPQDGHKPPTLAEKTRAVLEVAEFLLGPPTSLVAPLPAVEE